MSIINIHTAATLRYLALGFGVSYGVYRYESLSHFVARRNVVEAQQKIDLLVEEARVAFEAQASREQAILARKDGIEAICSDSHKFSADKWANWALEKFKA